MTRRKHRAPQQRSSSPAAETGPGRTGGGAASLRPAPAPAAFAAPRPGVAAPGFWLYGRHAVLAAVANSGRALDRLLALPETAAVLSEAAAAAPVARPAVETMARKALEMLLPADTVHQGFVVRARPLPGLDLESLLEEMAGNDDTLVVVLDQASDPRNVGAVLRSAQAFAAAAVVVQDRHAPEETGALAKAASGALEAVPLIRAVNLARAMRTLKEHGFHCVGLAGEATLDLAAARLTGRIALILGAEGSGLRRLVRETCDELARIPIAPGADSLNLSAAAAVALYECRRAGTCRPPHPPAAAR